ncbi:MAG: discoidin domain-containing protein [Planctomycetota bacterium]
MKLRLAAPCVLLWAACATEAPQLDAQQLFARQDFWVNRDFDWFARNIPLFECPDAEIETTYYYRWELLTRHLVYGRPASGYVFSEFANRPFWSGAYGTISCPAEHQIHEARWLRDPRFVRDYVRFWMTHPGAQPRNYSFPAAAAAWSAHEVQPAPGMMVDLLDAWVANFEGWEARSWVEDVGLFWQTGHDDGMEFDINARQTPDILRGGQSLRPSFNAYMWADARAIAAIARLAGREALARRFDDKAATIKAALEALLWDPQREFFFPMSNQRHEKDGFVVEPRTLTYQTGRYAGSPGGRELHGYVPWAYEMLDPGFEAAWRFLVDERYFAAPFGPTTVERGDPQFLLADGCCWWSGQSWPFATTQTLKAMASLLQRYEQPYVGRRDYVDLLRRYAVTQRKDGRPYIAEAANPFDGSWRGHDMEDRSEHYFHSGFVDLVVTGLVGLRPSADDRLVVDPLVADDWDWFALERLGYRGHEVAVRWDRTGARYGRGAGLRVFVDGRLVAHSPSLTRLEVAMPEVVSMARDVDPLVDFAVNNDGDYFPRFAASWTGAGSSLARLGDGQYVYDRNSRDRWTTQGSPHDEDWVEVDLGAERAVQQVELYVLDDGEGAVRAPQRVRLQGWRDGGWHELEAEATAARRPEGGRPFVCQLSSAPWQRLRAVLTPAPGAAVGLTEFAVWGPSGGPYVPPPPPAGNLAWDADGDGWPRATASFSDRYGGVPEKAIDGRIVHAANPVNRWTCYGSPEAEDWLEVDFGREVEIGRVVLHVYDDRGGVQPPVAMRVECLAQGVWRALPPLQVVPPRPTGGMANEIRFEPTHVVRLRVVFTHDGAARSGATELEAWAR